ncbi:hypothetical protein BDV95DRAFT_480224 [Massariosphaeria phaeospora]|uniref:Inhibitor I9 domain-containing protein n=1 Tax=Massariosphaeria phaeospora TaxID=100035 RepID=A0A7C8IFY1_9PLEO|nr:hypothetical protein BDV95DRAFT_480224 [Massariosphaeria phaeospora]
MRFAVFAFLFALLATLTMATGAPQRSVIISYPNSTPQSTVDEVMAAIRKAGGTITHVYNIIKGFSATGPPAAFEQVHSLSGSHTATIEEDGVVHANNGYSA